MENKMKVGHPVLGIVLGIFGVLIALFLTFLTGAIGGCVALLLGVLAFALGLSAKKKGGMGVGAMIFGVIAVVMAIVMTVSSIGIFTTIRNEAEKTKPGSLIAKSASNPYLGVVGLIINMPKDEASIEELMNEINEFQAAATAEAAK